jgi:hypothetical protein
VLLKMLMMGPFKESVVMPGTACVVTPCSNDNNMPAHQYPSVR